MALPTSGALSLNDIQTEFGGTNPIGLNEYYAGGGLVPASTSGTYGAVPSSGAITVQNFYGTSNFVPVYVENVFQTWLYTGTGTTNTITNGVDLAGNGGMVWMKGRGSFAENNNLVDTARGVTKSISTNNSDAQLTYSGDFTSFNANGFTLGAVTTIEVNSNTRPYVSWTFRKQPKFFDVVTYTGNGVDGRAISHSLGSIPGFVIVKRTDTTGNWKTYHYLTGAVMNLNTTGSSTGAGDGFCGSVSSTTFTVYASADTSSITDVNASGGTYVAYLFAHNAGGFGLTGTDNVISCGYFEDSAPVTLGYEPQWILMKRASGISQWFLFDSMRGLPVGSNSIALYPNLSNSDTAAGNIVNINATGFTASLSGTWIYIAIRRGPMKTPTSGASVFDIDLNGNSTAPSFTSAFPVDFNFIKDRARVDDWYAASRLTGTRWLTFNKLDAEQTDTNIKFDYQNGSWSAGYLTDYTSWNFRRAPGFFDVVCYSGNGATLTVNHNLRAVPEMIIIKRRNATGNWSVYTATTGVNLVIELNGAYGAQSASYWGTGPTSTTFQVASNVNSGHDFVAYLFASCPGVSKVGSYTGTGSAQTINCGFTGGARFVLIKRTDDNSSGTANWFIWDTTRGMVSGTDPRLVLNNNQAQVNQNDVFTTAGGFYVNSTANALNASGGTYIYLAIA